MIFPAEKVPCHGVRPPRITRSQNAHVLTAPNTLKVEYALNYMKIPFKKEFVSYPDIAEHHKKLGIQPNDPAAVKFQCASALQGTLNSLIR